ncbi:MAG: hypothetical protein KDA69_18360, partial [Planctomycetaceae bacterium]|nr:hypothetical protein [Planctomycetaceae bacterium]
MNLRNTFALLLVVAIATNAFGDVPQGVLTLSGGDAVSGAFENSNEPNILRWQGKHFLSPFEFDVSTVSSVNFPTQQPPAQLTGELAVELASGDMFTGRLLQWNDQHLEIDSVHFGVVHVKAESVRRIYRLTENPLLVYSGLTGVAGWNVHGTEWREDGPFLETSQDDAKISGDFQIPDKAMIEFELSWPQKPNFALVLGADPDLKEDKRQDGWRLEMWDQLLGVLREHKDIADVDRVAMILPSVKRVHLIAYLDQLEGSIQIFTADGSPAGKISVPPVEGTKPGRGIRIVNRHGTIRLERLRIARWNGQLPTSIPKGEIAYHLADGTTQLGIPQGFDADTREYMFKVGDDVKRSSEADVVMSERGPPEAVEARSMATMLQDGTRLSGQLERVEAASLVVQCPDIS